MAVRFSTDRWVALQFLAVILPVILVLVGQLAADARRAAALESSRPLRNLASEARASYRTFTNGAADAVDTGALSRQSAAALRAASTQLGELAQQAGRGEAGVLGDAPRLLARLAASIGNGAELQALLPLRTPILQGDQQTRAIEATFVKRDQAVVRDAIDSAVRQRQQVIAALLASLTLTVIFVLATRRRLRQQIEDDAAIERRRRAELEAISIRLTAATRAARAGVYELQQHDHQVWWSEMMHELYGQPAATFRPTLAAWLALIHPQDREAAAEAIAAALRAHQPLRTRYRVALPDGTLRHLESLAATVTDPAGAGSRLVGIDIDVTERVAAEHREQALQQQLRAASRQAGMAEVAASVLHNVGNVLNSVNVSANLVSAGVRQSKAAGLERVVALLRAHQSDLGRFIAEDERGRHLPEYLEQLARQLDAERRTALQELDALRDNIGHIKEVVAMQQNHAKLTGVTESCDVQALVEEGVRLNTDSLQRHGIALKRDFAAVPMLMIDKHRVLQILVNLLRNAKHACQASVRADKWIRVRVAQHAAGVQIVVSDNGIGILPENLTRIFTHGFTTKKDGHGFGLHSGALAARELGGALRAESRGAGHGATFILELPLQPGESKHEP